VDENDSQAIAQVVSHWLLTSPRLVHVGFVVDRVALGDVFFKYLVSNGSYHSISTPYFHLFLGLVQWTIYGLSAKGLLDTPTLKKKVSMAENLKFLETFSESLPYQIVIISTLQFRH
jgi:hypothetical protein